MAQAKQIQDRRETVRNIAKIARTMEMISTGRFRQFQQRVVNIRAYTDAVTKMVHNLMSDARRNFSHPLLAEQPEAACEAIVLMGSNRGLCGGYNQNVFKMAAARIAELAEAQRSVDIYCYGRKAATFCKLNGLNVVKSEMQFEREVDIESIEALAQTLIDGFLSGRYRSVQIAHSTFISTSIQRPMMPTILPLGDIGRLPSDPDSGRGRPLGSDHYDYLPNAETILDKLLPRTVSLRLLQAFLDAVLSEHVARMTSMHLAGENAGEMIRDLTMQFNRARQGAITTELAEIVTGVESMK